MRERKRVIESNRERLSVCINERQRRGYESESENERWRSREVLDISICKYLHGKIFVKTADHKVLNLMFLLNQTTYFH